METQIFVRCESTGTPPEAGYSSDKNCVYIVHAGGSHVLPKIRQQCGHGGCSAWGLCSGCKQYIRPHR